MLRTVRTSITTDGGEMPKGQMRWLVGDGLPRFQRGLFCMTSMLAVSDVLGWTELTGLIPAVLVAVAVALLFSVRVRSRDRVV